MRPRKWILLFILFISVFSFLLWQTEKWLEKNRSLEKIVTDVVSSTIKGKCSVEKIRIGFLSFYLKNVSIDLPSEIITIKIKEIKSGLSIVKLLKYRGDINRSISSIVFINPHIFITLKQQQYLSKDSISIPVFFFNEPKDITTSPVQKVIIKDGIVGILYQKNDTLLMAENLSGVMNSLSNEIKLSLDGRFGSLKKNFYMDINFLLSNNSTNFFIRLDNASLSKHIILNQTRISSGIVSGEIKGTILSSNLQEGIDFKGWLKLRRCEEIIAFTSNNVRLPFSSVEADVIFKGKECELKEAKTYFRGMPILANGSYTLLPYHKAKINVKFDKILPDSLYGIIPDSILSMLKGEIKASASLIWDSQKGSNIKILAVNGKIKNTPIDRIKIKGNLANNIFTAESIEIKTPFLKGDMKGNFYFTRQEKKFDVKFIINSDSFPDEYNLKGSIIVKGNFSSPFSKLTPVGEATILTKNILYQNLPIGSPSFSIAFKKEHCVFTTLTSEDSVSDISFNGTIDSLFSHTSLPFLTFTANLGSKPIKKYLERNNKIPYIDSIKLLIKGKGWLQKFDIYTFLKVNGKKWGGNIEGKLFKELSSKDFFKWRITTNNFRVGNYPLLIKAEGKVLDSIVTIDNISNNRSISGKFNIHILNSPPLIEGYLEYNNDASEFLEILKSNNIPLEKGKIRGKTIISGTLDSILTKTSLKIENVGNDFIEGLYSNIYIESKGKEITVLPTIIRLDTIPFLFLDTVKIKNSLISLNAKFDTVSLGRLLKKILPSDVDVDGKISGYFFNSNKDSVIKFIFSSPQISINSIKTDSITCKGSFTSKGISIKEIFFCKDTLLNFKGNGFLPWSTFSERSRDKDTLRFSIKADGDFLAAIENNFKTPIGGNGKGSADISFYSTEGNWIFTKGIIKIPDGLLKVKPYIPDNVKKFNFVMNIDSNCIVHTEMGGIIKNRPIKIFSEHDIPEGYEPFVIGPLNFGVLQIVTPKKGIDIHLVGFMAIKDKGDIEFKGKEPFSNFTLSGPIDKLKITGNWIVRDMDFTFPLLTIEKLDYNLDPFPFVTWEFDVYIGNRKVMYFWDVTGKRNRFVRFLECYLDPSSFLKVRGRDLDKTFRVYGSLRSYRGAFYYGKTFNRNLEIGVDFVPIRKNEGNGYDNMPILWGSAEAFSDSSRLDRIKITCMIEDPVTGTVSEKGRLKEQFPPNIIFNLSSNFEGIPEETELEFYRNAGIKFSSLEGTANAVSDFGEKLFHTYLLQKWERFIAKKLGLDVMNIETSIVSNYFSKLYNRRFTTLFDESDYMAFANIGVTIGRYFFRDYLLLKARSELIPVNMMLTPEYSIGFELQPNKYFIMDINYGVNIRESKIMHSPLLMMQLRLPISKMRKFFNF